MKNNYTFFKNKKILVIVPHQDDELNLVGGFLTSKFINKDNFYVAYMTNGDYSCDVNIRIKEVKNVLKFCGLKDDNIIFLGYCDQHFSQDSHIYMTDYGSVFESNKNKKNTYLTSKFNEFSFDKRGCHSEFNRDSLINDLVLLINSIKPDIIFVNDFDSHPDHRCLTLAFDYALGNILKNNLKYFPDVFKGFCYPTNYLGYDDFNTINLLSTNFAKEKYNLYEYQNPYYEWNKRIRFCVDSNNFNFCLLKNKLYKCLKMHKSQLIIRKYKSIINSDHIFWKKESNNLSLFAKITSSSGNCDYLNDCVQYDCLNIMHKDISYPVFKNVSWVPDVTDSIKCCKFEFDKLYYLDKINFYQNNVSKGKVKKITIEFSNKLIQSFVLDDKMCFTLPLSLKNPINWLKIYIDSADSLDAGFSEIEIIPVVDCKVNFLKILINDNFTNGVYYVDDNDYEITIYTFNGKESLNIDNSHFRFTVNGKKIKYEDLKLFKNYVLRVYLNNYSNIYDEVVIKHINLFHKIKFTCEKYFNYCIYFIDEKVLRVKNKVINFFRSWI